MPHASWMIERLNEETRYHHTEAGADFDVLFGAQTTPTNYRAFLMRLYGFEAPLELSLATTPDLGRVIDLAERAKTDLLVRDLHALGLAPQVVDDLPQCVTIPQFRGGAEALGWMYVVERTTLAHSVIRRHLSTRLPCEMHHAANYLSCYTGVVGLRWRQFGATLDEVAQVPALADLIVAAANDAFRCQRRWIRQDLQDTRAAI